MVQINAITVFPFLLVFWVVYRLLRRRAGRTVFAHEILVNLFFIYLCAVFDLTIFPINISLYAYDPYAANLVPFQETIRMLHYTDQPRVVYNLLGNLVLLAPLGIFLPLFFERARRAWVTVPAGFLISLSIESFQLALPFRIFDVDDVLINTLGVALGFCAFAILRKLPILSRGVTAISSLPVRPAGKRAAAVFGAVVLLAFLSLYSSAIISQTQTEAGITAALPAAHRQLIGIPRFGEFILVFSRAEDGRVAADIYRRIFFGRYTGYESHDPLMLDPDTFTVSAASTSGEMNYFVLIRSRREVAAVLSSDLRLPVTTFGDYHFAYTHQPADRQDVFFSFHFVDPQGSLLPISMVP
jgi:glycopeptide antibiotics resistance protein